MNPAHEAALGRLIEAELPGVPYTLSSRLNPIIREYRRASSAAIDASLKPLMQRHLRDMEEDLRGAGFGGQLLVATSFGGVMHAADVVQRPIFLVKSGPAMAPVAGRTYGEAEVGPRDLIVCDAGGTSFDVSLVHDRTITFTRETWLGQIFTGHITGMASVDVEHRRRRRLDRLDRSAADCCASAPRARAPNRDLRATALAARNPRSRTRRWCSAISIRIISSAAGCTFTPTRPRPRWRESPRGSAWR